MRCRYASEHFATTVATSSARGEALPPHRGAEHVHIHVGSGKIWHALKNACDKKAMNDREWSPVRSSDSSVGLPRKAALMVGERGGTTEP